MLPVKGALLDVVEVSRQAVTLSELAKGVLPALQKAFACSLGSFTHSRHNGTIDILDSTDESVLREYHREWFSSDPINAALQRYDTSWLIPATRLPEWQLMERHPLYADWAPTHHVRFLLHIRLSNARYLKAGACNVFLCRPREERDFGPREIQVLSQVLPDLQTAVNRCKRVAAMSLSSPLLERMLDDAEGRAKIAMRGDGQIVWVSKAAKKLLGDYFGRKASLPTIMIESAKRLTGTKTVNDSNLRFVTPRGEPITAELQNVSASTGEMFIVVSFRSNSTALPDEFKQRFCLTDAEADVLCSLAEGLSNEQIAQRRSVSITTVRTHVSHILSKMAIQSRLQAGLLARAAM